MPLLSLALLAIAARWQTFGNPVVGFDEQFYLLVGDRMLHGAVPFVDIFDRKPIGLFLIYAGSRLLGGDGYLQYKLVALLSVVATALGIRDIARRSATPFEATAAAGIYVLWLDFMEGEGGQSEVFYGLPVVLAARAVLGAIDNGRRLRATGVLAMIGIGIAMQINYATVVQGLFFGLVLLKRSRHSGESLTRTCVSALLWVASAATPTALVLLAYAADGHAAAFLFANFTSLFGQGRGGMANRLRDFATVFGIVSPLLLALLCGRPWRAVPPEGVPRMRFVLGWLGVEGAGIVAYGRFGSPHYAIPLLLPTTIALAPMLDTARRRRTIVIASIALAAILGQIVLCAVERRKGGRDAAQAAAAAATWRRDAGCIYVYDGYPALYMLTGSCLPTKWAFPGHLNTQDEASAAAIGIDPVAEERRIMAARPAAVIDDYPRPPFGNRRTHDVLTRALARGYDLVACIATGRERYRLVYRPRSPRGAAAPGLCPASAYLRRASYRTMGFGRLPPKQ